MSILIHLATTIIIVNHWWTMFFLNRLFEMTILYVAGCAIFRIWRRRRIRKLLGAARAAGAASLLAA